MSAEATVGSTAAPSAAGEVGAALRVEGVSKRFGGVQAVDDVSLTVCPGEAVAVIGPNGAGKSSLLKLLSGVYRPDRGSIHLNGERTDGQRTEAVARLGVSLASQVPQPFRGLTVRENVSIGALSSGRRSRRSAAGAVEAILDMCGLADKADLGAEPFACWTSSGWSWPGHCPPTLH